MDNFVLRAVNIDDLPDILDLIKLNTGGMTSLLSSKQWLAKTIERSNDSFQKNISSPDNEKYLFVLEELDLNKVIEISGIESNVGSEQPFFSYRLDKESVSNEYFNLRYERALLSLVDDYKNVSEICSLFLSDKYRKHGFGLYLSLVRFLFIKLFRERFAKKIIANMRGVIDKDGFSPFWQAVGHKFFNIDYHEAIRKTSMTNYKFLVDLFPKIPVYLNFLPQKAIKVIGRTHVHTKPALKMLLSEGFIYNNHVDVFDAGPIVEAELDEIATFNKVRRYRIVDAKNKFSSRTKYLVSNTSIDFYATVSYAKFVEDKGVILPISVINNLNVEIGDEILLV